MDLTQNTSKCSNEKRINDLLHDLYERHLLWASTVYWPHSCPPACGWKKFQQWHGERPLRGTWILEAPDTTVTRMVWGVFPPELGPEVTAATVPAGAAPIPTPLASWPMLTCIIPLISCQDTSFMPRRTQGMLIPHRKLKRKTLDNIKGFPTYLEIRSSYN